MGNWISSNHSRSAQRQVWYWKSNPNPWAVNETEEWTPYNDVENEIIEDSFKQRFQIVQLDDYWIEFKLGIQYRKTDDSKQRPIKRGDAPPIRKNRYRSPSGNLPEQLIILGHNYIDSMQTFTVNIQALHKFLQAGTEDADGNKVTDLNLARNAISGIKQEGKLLNKSIEAEKIANELLACLEKNPEAFPERCATVYTYSSFLFHDLNKALRENDVGKGKNLGAFCKFVIDYLNYPQIALRAPEEFLATKHHPVTGKEYKEPWPILFRGVPLTESEIDAYKNAVGKVIYWNSIISTSKNRQVAKIFGNNTVFSIVLQRSNTLGFRARDVSALSKMPDEEEVLLTPGNAFYVEVVEKVGDTTWIGLCKCGIHCMGF